jgi:glycosyltransferase involved in cell wall biosynthesis
MFLGLAAPFIRPAVVLTSQRNHQQVRKPAARFSIRISHRIADGIVVNCEAMRDHLVADEHLKPERIHLCYNGLDTERFRRMASPPSGLVPADAMVVGTLCALRPEKNLSVLLRAFAACLPSYPRLFLLLVGSGPEQPRLQAEAVQLGIAGRCRFEPTVADVVPWLSLMDIFVLPSRFEALPNALMEAMACGCAPVASRVGGTPELIAPGATGFLFQSDDVNTLVGHLGVLLNDAGLRRQIGERAVARIRSGFSLRASADRLGEIYAERMTGVPS